VRSIARATADESFSGRCASRLARGEVLEQQVVDEYVAVAYLSQQDKLGGIVEECPQVSRDRAAQVEAMPERKGAHSAFGCDPHVLKLHRADNWTTGLQLATACSTSALVVGV
jgi:hypothetical protein